MLRRLQRSASQPAGSEKHAEGDEHRGRERDQLGIGAAVHQLEADDDGWIDAEHEVVDRMRPVEEADGAARLRVVGIGGSGEDRHEVSEVFVSRNTLRRARRLSRFRRAGAIYPTS